MIIASDRGSETRPPAELLRGASLFLDFDGTLVDIEPTPGSVSVSRELRDLLLKLKGRLDGRAAILSGRSVADVGQLLSPVRILIGGSHGLETPTAGGERLTIERPACLDSVVAVGQRRLRLPRAMVLSFSQGRWCSS
jgi:trehalose 6-phosphate phosphatase